MADDYGKEAEDTKKEFRQVPEDRNKSELGQGKVSLAPMLHWNVDRTPLQEKEMDGKSLPRNNVTDND